LDPRDHSGWCFPDNIGGIVAAVQAGATHLWANTILFASHPLQTSADLDDHQEKIRVIGQPPALVEKYDDKNYVNNMLRASKAFTIPKGWLIDKDSKIVNMRLPYPVVAKPVRGRGSFGVKVCHSSDELSAHIDFLFEHSPQLILEEYLQGEEATITVMPPSPLIGYQDYWAMPIVMRFNHDHGIAPYSGEVAITKNSRVITPDEFAADTNYAKAARECEAVARLLQVTAPIRVDIRRFENVPKSQFALFDVNMKPVSLSAYSLGTSVDDGE
jgi:D-alanine-D-alanine ligase-like ATP-grasp enzyme